MSVGIVRVGLRTPLGLNAEQTAFLLRAGFSALAEAPLADAKGEPATMCFLPTIDGSVVGPERLLALAGPAFDEAVTPVRNLTAQVFVSIDEGFPDAPLAARMLEGHLRRSMPNATVAVEPKGEAGPGGWIAAATQALETRQVDVAVIGGVHTDYDPRILQALDASGRLFAPDNLDARIPGELAAFFVMMRVADATRQRLPPIARVLGVGSGRERARPDNDDPAYEALGMTAAVREAAGALPKGMKAGWMLADVTNEMRRIREWQTAMTRNHAALGEPYFGDVPAQRIGYLGAAAMPLFVGIAACGWKHRYAPADVVLAMAGNDTGARSAVCLQSLVRA